jgi:isopentenyl-diphosphate delta-isomerase|tara:strand:+ start:62 stop:742 length:681 start_codon:yes stop_codon:yes gene_type:complete
MPETTVELQGYDKDQIDMMEENCIIVDNNDNIIGKDTKVNCHLGEGKLHRAFSVLLFNTKNRLLIQKRASEKITFPSIWANSCCSHPLYSNNEEEGIIGAKKAAKRKLSQELGIDTSLIELSDIEYITKMHYRSRADKKWIEHEIDYIFVIKSDVNVNPNPNEIEETKYVDQNELQSLFDAADNKSLNIGPWFRLIKENFLSDIWDALDDLSNITDEKLHYMGDCE